eukprot:6681191-Karenia_brevis.AAC.1
MAGGLSLSVHKDILAHLRSWTDQTLVQGRLVRSVLEHSGGTVVLYNVHDYKWPQNLSTAARSLFLDDCRASRQNPL